ncbi:MAG: sulfite exporter TauE/SafE family protein [Pseudomonadota bacterium]
MSAEFGAVNLSELLPLIAVLAVSGVVAGFAAGLLGVGGGIVTVPVLEYTLRFAGVPEEWRMHVAVATSLAAIIPTSISSARIHHRRGAVDWELSRTWGVPMVLGAITGSLLASRAPQAALAGVFGSVALLISLKMLLPLDHLRAAREVPGGAGGVTLAALIGGISAMMGIGGGTLTVPTLNLCGYPIHRAVGTAAFFGIFISVPGTIGYLLARPPADLPWATVGFVSLVGLAIIAPGSMLTATLGARAAHKLSRRRLSQAFGVFLLLVGTRMVYRALA